MEAFLLQDLLTFCGLIICLLFICSKLNIPAIVGFLLAGVLAGPSGLMLISDTTHVKFLAELGIILLLFTVGMEFSIQKLLQYKVYFIVGGLLQVGITLLAGFGIALLIGRPFNAAILWGFLLSLSSTAIVLPLLESRRESDSPHGKITTGILIFQDLVAIPMMLFIPMLAGNSLALDPSLFWVILKSIILLGGVTYSAHYIVPKLLFEVAKTKQKELFLLCIAAICFFVAWISEQAGLSLSLGAFLAGLIVSDSDYKSEAIGDMIPFQGLFTSFFFITIGMLLDIHFFLDQPFLIISTAIAVLCLKLVIGLGSVLILNLSLRTAFLTGLALCQVGEFSFVLATTGAIYGIGDPYFHQLFLAVALLTMAISPSLITAGPQLADFLLKGVNPLKQKEDLHLKQEYLENLENHVLIIGYGLNGRHLAKACKETYLPFAIIEMNPETVRTEKSNGEPIHYGDATTSAVLQHLKVEKARTISVLINDPHAVQRIVKLARHLNPKAYIIVRTRYVLEAQQMYAHGANEAVADELGASLEIIARILRQANVDGNKPTPTPPPTVPSLSSVTMG